MSEPRVRVQVLHDAQGRILGIAEVIDARAAGSRFVRVGLLAGRSARVTEVEIEAHQVRALSELPKDHRIDEHGRLVKGGPG